MTDDGHGVKKMCVVRDEPPSTCVELDPVRISTTRSSSSLFVPFTLVRGTITGEPHVDAYGVNQIGVRLGGLGGLGFGAAGDESSRWSVHDLMGGPSTLPASLQYQVTVPTGECESCWSGLVPVGSHQGGPE